MHSHLLLGIASWIPPRIVAVSKWHPFCTQSCVGDQRMSEDAIRAELRDLAEATRRLRDELVSLLRPRPAHQLPNRVRTAEWPRDRRTRPRRGVR
jgi:hypothetical protein